MRKNVFYVLIFVFIILMMFWLMGKIYVKKEESFSQKRKFRLHQEAEAHKIFDDLKKVM